MSTVANVITGIRDDLKDTGTVQAFTDAQITRYMNRFKIHIAAMMYRNSIYEDFTSTNITCTSGSKTYTMPTNFFAEVVDTDGKGSIHFSNKTDLLSKKTWYDYIKGGHGTATATGTSGQYMILGGTLYLFNPVPSGGTVTLWYHYVNTAFSTTTTTESMPYNGILDEYWREFTSKLLLARDEYSTQYEEYLFKQLEGNILTALVGRSPRLRLIPRQGAGVSTKKGIDAVYT